MMPGFKKSIWLCPHVSGCQNKSYNNKLTFGLSKYVKQSIVNHVHKT